jgi:hypothetical protein
MIEEGENHDLEFSIERKGDVNRFFDAHCCVQGVESQAICLLFYTLRIDNVW